MYQLPVLVGTAMSAYSRLTMMELGNRLEHVCDWMPLVHIHVQTAGHPLFLHGEFSITPYDYHD